VRHATECSKFTREEKACTKSGALNIDFFYTKTHQKSPSCVHNLTNSPGLRFLDPLKENESMGWEAEVRRSGEVHRMTKGGNSKTDDREELKKTIGKKIVE
jgi:hypothetical protein